MNKYSLSHLGNAVLLRAMKAILLCVREATSMLLAHIAEVDVRKLYAPEGYSSMFAYCVEELHLSEDAAAKRIQAARAARRFPALFIALEEGRLHLTAICLIAPHLTPQNVDELIEAATHRKKSEIQEWLAGRFPDAVPTPVSVIRPIAQHAPAHVENGSCSPDMFSQQSLSQSLTPGAVSAEHALAHVGGANSGGPEHALAHVLEVPAPKRFLLRVELDEHTHERLRHAQALLSHSVAPSDVSQLLLKALEALIEKAEKRKLGSASHRKIAAQHPLRGTSPVQRASARKRHIPTAIRRAVWERDRGQCTFVSGAGHRCGERRFLEFDHVDPVARGGKSTVEGLRLRCRAHNQLEADRVFGAKFMDTKRHPARRTSHDRIRKAEGDASNQAKERDARARAEREEITRDVLAGLRSLGCRGEQARRAAQYSATIESGSLEERMRAALAFVSGRARATRCGLPRDTVPMIHA